MTTLLNYTTANFRDFMSDPNYRYLTKSAHDENNFFDLPLNYSGHHRYIDLDDNGALVTALAKHGRTIVGFSLSVIYDMIQTKSRHAEIQVIWLDQKYRLGNNGLKLLSFMESELAIRFVDFIHFGVPMGSKLGRVMKRLSYRPIETMYIKKVRDGS